MKIRSIILTYITVLITTLTFFSCAGRIQNAAPDTYEEPKQLITITNNLDYPIIGRVTHLFCDTHYRGFPVRLPECPVGVAELVPGRSYTVDVTGWKDFAFDVEGYEKFDMFGVTFSNVTRHWTLPKFRRSIVFHDPAVWNEIEVTASQLLIVGEGE